MSDARAEWLEKRQKLITASDAAAILGEDPYRGPLQVYAEKVEGLSQPEHLNMRRGRWHEGAIAEEYAEVTGRAIVNAGAFTIQRHPEHEWLGATLDRITAASASHPAPAGLEGSAPLEIKLAIGSARDWDEGPPLWYTIQLQIQIACYGASWGSLAAFVGPQPLHIADIARHDAFLELAIPQLEAFRERVLRQEPPPADGLPGTTEAVKRLFFEDGATVALDREALALADSLEEAKETERLLSKTVDEMKNRLRVLIGSASYGALPDGSMLTLRTTERKAYEVPASSFRVLRRWWPKGIRRKG